MLTMSETIKKKPNVSLVFYFEVGVVEVSWPSVPLLTEQSSSRRSPPVTQAAPRCKPRACVNARKVELLCGRTSARNSILILQDRCRVRRSLQRQRPNNGRNCIRQPAGAENSSKKKKKKVRQVVRQLPAFHVLHFKHLLPDAGAVKLATRSSCEPAAFHSLSGIFLNALMLQTGGSPDWTINTATTFCQLEPHTDLICVRLK